MSCRDLGYRVSEESFWKFGNGKLLKKLYIKKRLSLPQGL